MNRELKEGKAWDGECGDRMVGEGENGGYGEGQRSKRALFFFLF